MTTPEFEKLIQSLFKPLRNKLVGGYSCGFDLAEEAIQEAMVYILQHHPSPRNRLWHYKTKSQMVAIVFQCAEHRLIDILDRERVRHPPQSRSQSREIQKEYK